MPWSATEAVTNKEYADEDRNCESHVRGDGSDGEDGTDRYGPAEDEEQKSDAHGSIKPYRIHRGIGVFIDTLDPPGHRETAITSISEGDSGSGDHAALAHGEAADDSEAEDCESDLLRHDLHEV